MFFVKGKNGLKLVEFTIKSYKMGTAPVIFQAIRIDMPIRAVYRRLGYQKGKTEITKEQLSEIEAALSDAASLVELKGSAILIPVREQKAVQLLLDTGEVFKSASLLRMLEGSTELLLMGATAGNGVMDEISRDSKTGNLTRAVLLDAVASEMTDKALDWITGHMSRELTRQGKGITHRRFSAGYGDFELENQKIMYERLQLQEIGVKITDSCVLVPEKSVTAVAGVRVGGFKQ